MRLAIALLFIPAPAFAFESFCRVDPALGDFGGALEASICDLLGPGCVEGYQTARGRNLGEHTYIAREALIGAGLGDIADDPMLLRYYGPKHAIEEGVTSLEPGRPGARLARIERQFSLSEFSQVVDFSHSLSDFLLGNEHCPLPNFVSLKDCHQFTSHSGAVNSTHFPPQARAAFELYHNLALATAERCKATADAFSNTTAQPLASVLAREWVPACEREALALEATAQHFLADAWAMGHMWQRWGSPLLEATPDGQFRQTLLGAASGLIHGYRALARGVPGIALFQHDQLSMPGPLISSDFVVWKYPGSSELHAGGGDEYLLECTVNNEDWSVAEGSKLTDQWEALTTCGMLGFEEVYARGPKTRGELTRTFDADTSIPSVTDDRCWTQRATNGSMLLGSGISYWSSLAEPAVIARLITSVRIPSAKLLELNLTQEQVDVALDDFFDDLIVTQFYITINAVADREGLASAELDNELDTFLGFERNSAYAGMITEGRVPYYEPADRSRWIGRPGEGRPCTTTEECGPGNYCEAPDAVTRERLCTPYEASILRAFRTAEVLTWCEQDTRDDLRAAHGACDADPMSDACDACVEMVLPKLRDACDQASFEQLTAKLESEGMSAGDQGSICDVLAPRFTSGVHRPHAGTEVGANAAARDVCTSDGYHPRDSMDVAGSPTYDLDRGPPATAVPLGEETFVFSDRYTCGATIGSRWHRYSHGPADPGDVHTFRAAVENIPLADGTFVSSNASELELVLYEGPDCTNVLETATPNGNLLEVRWMVPANGGEVCLELSARGADVWARYDLTVEGTVDPASWQYSFSVSSNEGWVCESTMQMTSNVVESMFVSCPGASCIAGIETVCGALGVGQACTIAVPSPAVYASGTSRGTITRLAELDYRIDLVLDYMPARPPNMPEPVAMCPDAWESIGLANTSGTIDAVLPLPVRGNYRLDLMIDGNLESIGCGSVATTSAFNISSDDVGLTICPGMQAMSGTPIRPLCMQSQMISTFGLFTLRVHLDGFATAFKNALPFGPGDTCSVPNTSALTAIVHLEPQ